MMTLGLALLSDTYPANQLGAEMGKVMIGQTLGLMVGPPIGGFLQDQVGEKAPYVFCLILIAIDLTARLLIIEPRSAKVRAIREFQKHQELQREAGQASQTEKSTSDSNNTDTITVSSAVPPIIATNMGTIWKLLKNKRLLTAVIVSFVQAFQISVLEPILPLYLDSRFGLSKTQIGVVFLALSIPSFVSPIAGWYSDKHGAKAMSAVAIAVCAILVVLTGVPGMPFWAVVLFLMGIGATSAVYITPVLGEVSAVVRVTGDGNGFARALALFNMCCSSGAILGTVIYQETNMLWTYVLVAILSALLLPLVLLFMGGKEQKLRDQEQYERGMHRENMVLDQIHQQNQQQQHQQR
ncbi:hypothetical protein EDD11_008066 [Mortierella claussenii]|nr:hypothetical protein EDD11_008066 [Mortierella claussenii]